MQITIDIDENEIIEATKKVIIADIAKKILDQYHSSAERYCYRHVIKDCVREVIKSDIDNLSKRAVDAAAVSVTNKTMKKVSTEELLARIAGRDGK